MKPPTRYLKLGLSKRLTCGPYPAHPLPLYSHKQRMAFTDVCWQSLNSMIGNIISEPELRISVFSLVDLHYRKNCTQLLFSSILILTFICKKQFFPYYITPYKISLILLPGAWSLACQLQLGTVTSPGKSVILTLHPEAHWTSRGVAHVSEAGPPA